jgi:hypothetical protein
MSDERVTVNKGLLDNLSNSVQALTGTAEKMSIQDMSNAVGAKANEKFELIDTIVLTEEVKLVERTKEPDGTDYNFKEMLVEVSFPTRDKLENDYSLGVVRANFGLLTYSPYFVSGALTILHNSGIGQLQRIYLYEKIDKQMCLMYSNYGSDGSAYSPNNMAIGGNFGHTTEKSIKKFTVSTTKPFPVAAKPTIKIYGIRA